MQEIWKDIEGYEGYYQVSNYGQVKSLTRMITEKRTNKQYYLKGRTLKQTLDKDGYFNVTLTKNNCFKTFKVHRLVAIAFIENDDKENKTCINHKDENKSNNRINNLEWCTHLYNNTYGTKIDRTFKTREKEVAVYSAINGELIKVFENLKQVSDYYKMEIPTIRYRINNNVAVDKNLIFKYYKQENKIDLMKYYKILQFDLNNNFIKGYFNANDIIIDDKKLDNSNILKCCHGKISSIYGYIWKFNNKQ